MPYAHVSTNWHNVPTLHLSATVYTQTHNNWKRKRKKKKEKRQAHQLELSTITFAFSSSFTGVTCWMVLCGTVKQASETCPYDLPWSWFRLSTNMVLWLPKLPSLPFPPYLASITNQLFFPACVPLWSVFTFLPLQTTDQPLSINQIELIKNGTHTTFILSSTIFSWHFFHTLTWHKIISSYL